VQTHVRKCFMVGIVGLFKAKEASIWLLNESIMTGHFLLIRKLTNLMRSDN